jgi:Methyltransferase domain
MLASGFMGKPYQQYLNQIGRHFRMKRFGMFEQAIAGFGGRPLKILDVGGTEDFWISMDFHKTEHEFTILNVESWTKPAQNSNFKTIVGNGCKMPEFADQSFDVVFSNSVIEHVGSFLDQHRMAQEVMRVGKCFFVQTPNYYFPLEPHFHVPAFQMLPVAVRTKLIQNFALGCMPKVPNEAEARELAETTRLIRKHEMVELFPKARILEEKLGPLTKSLIATKAYAG